MVPGIDVSNWQGTIDWQQVVSSGVAFAFIKATEGATFRDARTAANFSGATAVGIIAGFYHFFKANTDPHLQADNFLTVVNSVVGSAPILPLALDLEEAAKTSDVRLQDNVRTFVDHIKKATGSAPIIYVSPNFWDAHMADYAPDEQGLWIAHWNVKSPRLPARWHRWIFWQHSSTGSIAGIHGNVDLDWFNGSRDELLNLSKPHARRHHR